MDCFSKARAPGRGNIDFIIAIVVRGWANVPEHDAMASKGTIALSFLFIDDGVRFKGCHGRLIEVKDTKHLVVGQKLGIDAGRTKEIDSDLGLREKLAPDAWGGICCHSLKG